MTAFPQLSTGAVSQLPLTRTVVARTVTNSLEDGSTIRLADSVSQIRWSLSYTGLSQDEWSALSSFFVTKQGQLNAFTFVDPTANLLSWSEDLLQAVWIKGPLIEVTAGISDPLQTNSASRLTNTSQAVQGVAQNVPAPPSYTYCFSVYLRCDQACAVTMRCATDTVTNEQQNLIGVNWARYTFATSVSGTEDGVSFQLLFPAGITLDIFGMQVEAQPGAGDYKKSSGPGGVFPASRFAQDELSSSVDSPGLYSTQLSIVTSVSAD